MGGSCFALKSGISLPAGDENKGLGNGRMSYGLTFITTKEIEPLAKLQADKEANRKGIWHVSLASEVEVIKDLKAAANIGVERKPDNNVGIKGGLITMETDSTFLAGIALRP